MRRCRCDSLPLRVRPSPQPSRQRDSSARQIRTAVLRGMAQAPPRPNEVSRRSVPPDSRRYRRRLHRVGARDIRTPRRARSATRRSSGDGAAGARCRDSGPDSRIDSIALAAQVLLDAEGEVRVQAVDCDRLEARHDPSCTIGRRPPRYCGWRRRSRRRFASSPHASKRSWRRSSPTTPAPCWWRQLRTAWSGTSRRRYIRRCTRTVRSDGSKS